MRNNNNRGVGFMPETKTSASSAAGVVIGVNEVVEDAPPPAEVVEDDPPKEKAPSAKK